MQIRGDERIVIAKEFAVRLNGVRDLARFRRTSFVDSYDGRLDAAFFKSYLKKLPANTQRFLQPGDHTLKRTSKRRTWTTAHVRELKSLARKKTPAKKIARTLKRTEGATRQKAFSMGLSLDSRL
jgi:hypothetical protein